MGVWQGIKEAKKSSSDKLIGGVCGGLGKATGIPSWLLRAGFLFFLLAYGAGFLVYLVLWICMPQEVPNRDHGDGKGPNGHGVA